MYDSVMTIVPVTPNPAPAMLIADHWVRERGYRVFRPEGGADYLLLYTQSGSGRLKTAEYSVKTTKNDLHLYPPHAAQDYATERQAGRWEFIWAHFHPPARWLRWLDWPEAGPGLRHLHLDDLVVQRRVERHLARMIRHERSADPRSHDLAMNALEAALLHAAPPEPRPTIDERLAPVLQRLHTRFSEAWTIEQLADAACLSPSRFAHLFREQLGTTPMQFLENQRLQRAGQLLAHTGQPVAQVARAVGFVDPLYFSRRFAKAFGQSPRAYRRHALTTATATARA